VPIFLIRHAHAGSRSGWQGDDLTRPLSARGRAQADGVRDLLAGRSIGRLFSSPSHRCLETLEPLARHFGRDIEPVDELAEGASGETAERFLRAHAAESPVACSHGDVIPRVLHRLHAAGMRAATDTCAAKGSVWVLDADRTGAVVSGTYLAPVTATD
jgi:broad specificity phosphatase PhoE